MTRSVGRSNGSRFSHDATLAEAPDERQLPSLSVRGDAPLGHPHEQGRGRCHRCPPAWCHELARGVHLTPRNAAKREIEPRLNETRFLLAEGMGFEPMDTLPHQRCSRPSLSSAQATFRSRG